jgi:hypothetical protein
VLKMVHDLHNPIDAIKEATSQENIDKILIVMALWVTKTMPRFKKRVVGRC